MIAGNCCPRKVARAQNRNGIFWVRAGCGAAGNWEWAGALCAVCRMQNGIECVQLLRTDFFRQGNVWQANEGGYKNLNI